MGFVITFVGILGFCIGLPIGLAAGFFFFIYSEPKDVVEPVATPLQEFDTDTLLSVLPDIPNWVKSPDYERVDWLNTFVSNMWPYLDKAICNTIRSTAKPIFPDYIGKYQIKDIDFENLSLGTLPPTFYGMKVYETNEKQLVLEPAIRWAGNPNIVLVVKLMSAKIRIQLVDVQVFANPRIHLEPLVPTFPCFETIVVTLMKQPHVDFGLKVLGGDVMSIPGVYCLIQETVKKQVTSLCHWPKFYKYPIFDQSKVVKPIGGILYVKVIRAMKLWKIDLLVTCDPYVKLRLSNVKRTLGKTSIKNRTLHPMWNEDFQLFVKDSKTQVLELQVFDWDKFGGDDKMGMQVVPLNQLTPHEKKKFTLDLLKSSNVKDSSDMNSRGKLVVELTFDPFKSGRQGNDSIDRSLSDASISSESGALLVNFISAKDVEGGKHTNAYAQIVFRGEIKKTKTIERKRILWWDEHFSFIVDKPLLHEKLHIEIFSKRRTCGFTRKKSVGFVELRLADVVNNGCLNEKYGLIDSEYGIIHVKLVWQTV